MTRDIENAILSIVTKRDIKEVTKLVPYGKRLVKLRGEKSQAEVAKALGIATSTLGMYETEQRMPRDSIKIALAEYYHTSVQKIFFAPECHERGQLNKNNEPAKEV